MAHNNLALSIKSLDFSYGEREVLKDLNISIQTGESVGIVGSNGAGKTTLFQLVCGILKPKAGKIVVLGEEVVSLRYNPQVGYVFQNPDDQLFSLAVMEDLTFGPLNMGISREKARDRAIRYLKDLGLEHVASRSPHHLSLGEKRMCSIASVLIMEPQIIILDEPTSNLDSYARRELIDYLNNIKQTKVIASHDLEFILETCPQVAILHDKKILVKGNTREVFFDGQTMEKAKQEIPYSLLYKNTQVDKG